MVLEKTKKVAKWAVPASPDIEKQIDKAMKLPEVRKAYLEYEGDPETFKEGLRKYIELENYDVSRMRKFATGIDTGNKSLVPFDAVTDAMIFAGGVGAGVKATTAVAKLPFYLTYDAYYLGKTGDLAGTLGNFAYELGSWFLPGSAPHLINYYTNQADKYATKEGAEKFLSKLERKASEFEKFKEKKSKSNLEDLAEVA
jgi:hypothetical protein